MDVVEDDKRMEGEDYMRERQRAGNTKTGDVRLHWHRGMNNGGKR